MKSHLFALLLFTFLNQLNAQNPSRYHLDVGQRFKLISELKQTLDQEMFGKTMKYVQTFRSMDFVEVVEKSGDRYKLKMTGLERKMTTEMDSNTEAANSNLMGEDDWLFRASTQKTYFILMDAYGQILDVTGLEAVRSDIEAELKKAGKEDLIEQVLSVFDKEQLITINESIFQIYQVPDSDWTRTTVNTQEQVKTQYTQTFSWDRPGVIVSRGMIQLLESSKDEAGNKMIKFDGTSRTTFEIDEATGLSTKAVATQTIEAETEIMEVGIPMTMKVEQVTKIEW